MLTTISLATFAIIFASYAASRAIEARDDARKAQNDLADYKNLVAKKFAYNDEKFAASLAALKADVIKGASLAASVIMNEQKDEIEKLKKKLEVTVRPIIVTTPGKDAPNSAKKPSGRVKPARVK